MKKSWIELDLQVPAAAIDLVCHELCELGCEGVTVEERTLDTFVIPGPDDNPPVSYAIKAYFPHPSADTDLTAQVARQLAWLEPLAPGLFPLSLALRPVRNEDWAEGWKQHFTAVHIGNRLVVKPSWEEYAPAAGEVIVTLDPGMAFGTGTHGTTRLCLEAIADLYTKPPYPQRVLDVGTGSGILAIAAAALGATRVLACDIEEESCQTATANAALNGVSDRVAITDAPLASLENNFDIVVANILAEENIRLAPELINRLVPGGTLILSGILQEKQDRVTAAFASYGLTQPTVSCEAEWVCLRYRTGR